MMPTLEKVTAESQSGATQSIPSWESAPFGVVSLFDMLRFYADFFVKAIWEMNHMEAGWSSPSDSPIPIPASVAASLVGMKMECGQHGLTETEKKCDRIMHDCHTRRVTFCDIVRDLKELRERLEDELQSRVFLCLTSKEGQLYVKPDDQWEPVIGRFYKLRHDIEESSKCFALGRYAAALFHVMLVAEFGIIQVAKLFDSKNNKPGWSDLERLRQINEKQPKDRTPVELQHKDFLKNLMPLALAMKDSWRHKISHAENKLEWMDTDFSPEVAGEIISATRGFMRRLAQDLPK